MFTIRGTPRDLEGTPVVAGGVMYVTSVNETFALDARSGREIWHYSRPRTQGLAGDAASGINRGVALLGDRVFMVTDHAHLIALHRDTGQLLWDVEMADSRQNYGATGAPLVVNDLVIAGVSGGDEGIRGFVDAYRASVRERIRQVGRHDEHGLTRRLARGDQSTNRALQGIRVEVVRGDFYRDDLIYAADAHVRHEPFGLIRYQHDGDLIRGAALRSLGGAH